MKLGPKALLPALVLVGSLAASAALVVARPAPEASAVQEQRPVVAVVEVAPQRERMRIRTQGTLEPRTENELVAEVGGRLAWVAPSFENGGFFAAGEVLARIEAADYEIALERARAALERTRSQRKLAESSLLRRRALREAGAASLAAHDQAESNAAIAAAGEREAAAALRQAELELARTELRAPFTGRVREKKADVGQLVARGAPLASLFAVDFAELRRAMASEERAYLELPVGPGADAGVGPGTDASVEPGTDASVLPLVHLSGSYAGRTHTWQGRVVRSEGTLDPRTRLAHVIARVDDPYGLVSGAPPLAGGLFVTAEIEGREVADAVRLPRGALHGDAAVVVVDAAETLRSRPVDVLRIEGETAFVVGGLRSGERVVARVPSSFVEGMHVRVGDALDDKSGLDPAARRPSATAVEQRRTAAAQGLP
jgi:RND family efflux transporter MFP subunit